MSSFSVIPENGEANNLIGNDNESTDDGEEETATVISENSK